MKTKNMFWSLMTALGIVLAMIVTHSCSSDGDDFTGLETEDVENPTRIQHYDNSPQFISDLETLIDYSCAVYAMRVAFWNITSNDFKTGEPFVATPEDIDANTTSIYDFYDIAASITEKADQYEEAFTKLEQEGVLENVNTSPQTRGFISDTFSFIFGLKKSQEVGRKSVLAVIQQSGWQDDDNKLQHLFNQVDPGRRQGYTNARQFWADFSQGKLDAKSNQIFQDLYHGDAENFGLNARELGFSPTGNMTKTAAMLIEKGISVVIDAAPGGMAGAMTMGKDLYNTYEATEDVVKHTVNGTLTREEAQRLVTQWASNLINYNDKILNNIDGGKWDATIDMWDTPGDFLGQEFANLLLNEPDEMLTLNSDDYFDAVGYNTITVKTKDGQSVDVAIVVDEEGKARIGVVKEKDGSFKVKTDKKKKKKVTVADKNGHRKTTEVDAGEEEVTIDVEEELDEPKDGYIEFSPSTFDFPAEGGTQRIKLTTNYLYYGVTTSVDDAYWLEANPVPLSDEFTITAQANTTGEPRTGKIIVKATNKQGKVLKFITIKATQQPGSGIIKATPNTLEFGADGGTKSTTITCEGFKYLYGYLDDSAEGWVTLDVNLDQMVFNITVAPNNTGEPRTGKVIAYGCNVPDPKMEDLTTTAIVIRQEAKEDAKLGNAWYVNIYPNYYIYNDREEGMIASLYTYITDLFRISLYDKGLIKTEKVGNNIHVEGRYEENILYDSYLKNASFSFDIINASDDFKNSRIDNLKVNITDTDLLLDNTYQTYSYSASNIPFKESAYFGAVEFEGTVEGGMTNYSFKETGTSREVRDDPRNSVNINIGFEKAKQ